MQVKSLLTLFLSLVASSCAQPTGTGKAKLSHAEAASVVAATVSADGAEVTATLRADSKQTQTLQAPASSPISGVSTSFPPGALTINADVTLAPGVDIIDTESVNADLGLTDDTTMEKVGSSVSIQAGTALDTATPFTLAIPVPDDSLALQGVVSFAVVFKSESVAENSLKFGVIPTSAISVVDGSAVFKASRFGTYQLVRTNKPIENAVEKSVATLVATNPAVLTTVRPFVADAGSTLKLTGKDFTGRMVVTIAGRIVTRLDVKSDVSASLVVPNDVPFGFTDISIAQAGATSSYGLIARSNDKKNLPLITMEPAGVCAGVTYYDAQGDEQIGTRKCESSGSVDMSKYDANGDGIIDKAESATRAETAKEADSAAKAATAATAEKAETAAFADEAAIAATAVTMKGAASADVAAYAVGRQGAAITADSTITLPGNGDYYEVSGNMDTAIESINGGSPGNRITLYFTDDIQVVSSAQDGNIRLQGNINLSTFDGLILELLYTSHGWLEVNRIDSKLACDGFDMSGGVPSESASMSDPPCHYDTHSTEVTEPMTSSSTSGCQASPGDHAATGEYGHSPGYDDPNTPGVNAQPRVFAGCIPGNHPSHPN